MQRNSLTSSTIDAKMILRIINNTHQLNVGKVFSFNALNILSTIT